MEEKKKAASGRRTLFWAGALLLGLALVLNMFLTYRQYKISLQERPGALLRISGVRQLSKELLKGRELTQDFRLEKGMFTGFSLEFATYGKTCLARAQAELYRKEDQRLLGRWTLQGAEILDNQPHRFDLAAPVQIDGDGESFLLKVRAPDGTPGNSFSLYRTEKDLYRAGALTDQGEASTDLALEVYGSDYANVKFAFVFLAACSAVLYGAACLYVTQTWRKKREIPLERAAFCLILLLGTVYIFVMPPHSAPDEPAHFATAYSYANKILLKEGADENGYAWVRLEDMTYNEAQKDPTAYSYQLFWDDFFSSAKSGKKTAFGSRTLKGVWPLAYVPQIAGILLSRFLHLGGAALLTVTRFFALAFYAACGYFAVKKMPYAKGMLALIMLFPMSLELGASCSYDCTMLALLYLFVAQVWRCIYGDAPVTKRDWALLAGIAALTVPLKIVYFPLFALCLLIPAEKCQSIKSLWAGRACVLGGGAISLLAVRLSSMIYYLTRTEFQAAKGQWQGISFQDLLAHPAMGVRLLAESLRSQGDFYISTLAGGKLGWLNTEIPDYLVYGFWLLVLLAAVRAAGEKRRMKAKERMFAAGLCAVTALATFGVFLLTWTAAGAEYIDGVQGRYFLPALPVLLLSLQSRRIQRQGCLDAPLLAGAVLFHIGTLWAAFQVNLLR